MPDPNGNPPPPSSASTASEPADATAPASPHRPAPLTPAPRTNPTSVFNPKDAPPPVAPAAPAGFSDFVSWMQSFSAPPAAAPPTPTNPDGRALRPREQKKFHRNDQDAPRPEPSSPGRGLHPEEGVAASPRTPRPPLAEPSPAPEQTPVIRRRRPKQAGVSEEPSVRFPWRLLIVVALLTGSFFYGRKTAFDAAARTAPPPSRVTLDHGPDSALVAGLLDQAMTAEQRGDYAQAAGLLQQAQQKGGRTPGILYHLALLSYEGGDYPRAMSLLNHSVDAGEEVAACFALRGLLNNRTSGITRGLGDLEAATTLDPFNARYFYYLGEARRRGGKPQAALNDLLHAVDRLREPELESLYQLKIRLTQVELGQENEFADQLAAELRRTPPPLDWLLTAAAVEMHAGRLDTAAGFLDKAATLADARTLEGRLRDYFFYSYANEKALERFYAGIHRADTTALAAHRSQTAPTRAQLSPTPALTAAPTP